MLDGTGEVVEGWTHHREARQDKLFEVDAGPEDGQGGVGEPEDAERVDVRPVWAEDVLHIRTREVH